MKVLTVAQPWAHLMAHGIKKIENRSWTTKYRGPLAIHASLTYYDEDFEYVEREMGLTLPSNLPGGAIIGICQLADVVRKSDDPLFTGPYGWVLTHARPLAEPIECSGKLGLWEPTDREIVKELLLAAEYQQVKRKGSGRG